MIMFYMYIYPTKKKKQKSLFLHKKQAQYKKNPGGEIFGFFFIAVYK